MLAQLAQAVRERTVSAVEFVQTCLERIERLNPPLNAVTEVWAEEAIARGRRVDEGGAEDPLAGLPLLVKANKDVKGKVTSYASRPPLERSPAKRTEVTV